MTERDAENFVNNVLNEGERQAIEHALTFPKPWTHEQFQEPIKSSLESAKSKIKNLHVQITTNKCCYCRRSLNDANIETDREHIVPKGKVKSLAYNIFNLSVSCKRCNMTYKGEKVDHIIGYNTIEADLRNPDRYRIPHPNIDEYERHITRTSIQFDSTEITTYKCHSVKGSFLYTFVRLDKLCVNQLDEAQGGKKANERIAEIFGFPVEGI